MSVKIIWSDSNNGSDTTGNGSMYLPYKTIDKALTVFTNGDQIRLMSGLYTPDDSIVINGLEGSIFSEDPLGVSIQPKKTTLHQACLAILNSPRFYLIGFNILQAIDAYNNLMGIYADSVDNFLCKTCAVHDFESPSGNVTGIFARGTGRLENCQVYNMTVDGPTLKGIDTYGIEPIDCETTILSGSGTVKGVLHDGLTYISPAPPPPMCIPPFYIDNVNVLKSQTSMVRGNKVSDCTGQNVIGIDITNCDTLRAKDNSAVRLRSLTGQTEGIKATNIRDAVLVYNVASRCDVGFDFQNITTLHNYNATTHNCGKDYTLINVPNAEMYNLALSVYENHKAYLSAIAFELDSASTIAIDYYDIFGIGTLNTGGHFTAGDNVYRDKPLYFDEANDDLTPDPIAILVNTGTANPLSSSLVDIGGIESPVTNEITADRSYHRNLMDNTFWDVDNDLTAEVSWIKAFQSRILANVEMATNTVHRDFYIKQMESALGFAELWPTNAGYQNSSKFQKRVADLWYAVINPETIQSAQNSIGGYNLYPSFFKRLEDISDCWVLGQSAIAVDNTLLGYEGAKYGILIDMLGTSTISYAMSGECYNNVMDSVVNAAPTKWLPHSESQPPWYLLFADSWNNFEECVLTNMFYNDDFNISPTTPNIDCECLTPLIPTGVYPISGVVTLGPAPSGGGLTEISLLDRMYSEVLTRQLYYRQGNNLSEVGVDTWTEATNVIGGYVFLDKTYVQFKLAVQNILRVIDYEFLGLALRPWEQKRTGWPNQQKPTPPPTPPVIHSFTATPDTISLGNSTVLAWDVTGATQLSIDNGVGAVTPVTIGSVSATPTITLTYTLTATNAVGMFVTSTVSVTVVVPGYMYLTGFSAYRYLDGDLVQLFDSGATNESKDIMPFSTTDIWVAGKVITDTKVGLHHYDGASWTQYLATTSGVFNCVNGAAPNDVWAGGGVGPTSDAGAPMLWHFDGATWTQATLPAIHGNIGAIWDILVLDSNNVYAVGEDIWIGPAYPLVYHWNGSGWAYIPYYLGYAFSGFSVWGTDSSNVWIGGTNGGYGFMLKYNGSNLELALGWWDYPWIKPINALYGFSTSDIWAACGDNSNGGVIAHWNGATWSHITDPVSALKVNWSGVWGKASNDVFITGFVTVVGPDYGKRVILHWDGANLTQVYNGASEFVTLPSFNKMKGILS